jgi:AraC-like DNA-binding protein
MEEAVKLLNETDWKAYQIADKIGIKDPFYFSNCFKKVMGVSIQEYKKNSKLVGGGIIFQGISSQMSSFSDCCETRLQRVSIIVKEHLR